jgi:hypothetical protein
MLEKKTYHLEEFLTKPSIKWRKNAKAELKALLKTCNATSYHMK